MTWVRLDDQFADHPKVVGLSAAAFRLHVTAICYAARQETDGVIPRGAAFVLTAKRCATELVAAGLWEEHPAGFLVHDYLEYNPSSASLREKRAADSARKNGGIQPEAKRPDPYPTRTPDPDPHPAPAREAAAAPRRRDYVAVENLTGLLNATVADAIDEFRLHHPSAGDEWIEAACEEAALNNARSWKYVVAILTRWERDGFKADTRPKDANGRKLDSVADSHGAVNTGTGLAVKSFEQEARENAAMQARHKR